jgi:predicted AAA+ superfamily ATPase
MTGLNRNLFSKVNKLLQYFPVVTLLGARQVGKTTLSRQLRPDWRYIDLEKPSDFSLVNNDPEFFLSRQPNKLIIDEAQEMPILFNILRGVIDQDRKQKGRYIITGSSSPELLKHISESLAGRVAIVEVGTLKANEIYQQPLSPFYNLFQQKLSKSNLPDASIPPLTREHIHHTWLKGGYPEPSLEEDRFAFNQWMENYQSTYINRDVAKLFPRLNRIAYQRFLTIMCKLSGTIINKAQIARDIEVSETTVKEYFQIANGTFLWRQLLSYEKNIKKSVVKMPTGYIRDTGLLHYLLKVSDLESLYADPIVGRSFESFVIEEIIKGLQATAATNWDAYYYRTRNAAEIDLILDGPFGILPIEIKYGTAIKPRQLRTITNFVEEQKLPFGLLLNQAEKAEWISPQIYQLPVGWI